MENRPIGIFDSGVGGLAITKVIQKELPQEDFIYIADLLNCPYGPKSKKEIRTYVEDITNYLVKLNVKAIVVACNTASVEADNLNLDIPVIKMIEPTISEALNNNNNNNFLLLGTKRTIDSQVYEKQLLDSKINLYKKAMPEFVELVENLQINNVNTFVEVAKLLNEFIDKDIGTVILGCTHFGFLTKEIKKVFPSAVLVSGAKSVSEELKKSLIGKLNTKKEGTLTLLTTANLSSFKTKADYYNISYDKINTVTTK